MTNSLDAYRALLIALIAEGPFKVHYDSVARQIGVRFEKDSNYSFDPLKLLRQTHELAHHVRRYLSAKLGSDIGINTVRAALKEAALKNKVNPVWDYLSNVRWDQTPRVDNWLSTYLGVDEHPSNSRLGLRFLHNAIQCAKEQGESDCVLNFVHNTDSKDVNLAALFGQWHSDYPIVIGNKDLQLEVARSWAACVQGDLVASPTIDNFLFAKTAQYREPGNDFLSSCRRNCVLYTNTRGTVEAIPFVIPVTLELKPLYQVRLMADRDQLWAEAMIKEHYYDYE